MRQDRIEANCLIETPLEPAQVAEVLTGEVLTGEQSCGTFACVHGETG
jgi:ribulose-bisphosphate carboxylase large chain